MTQAKIGVQGRIPQPTGKGTTWAKASLERLLVHWRPTPGQPISSVYLRPGEATRFLGVSGAEGQRWWEHLSLLGPEVTHSDTGLAGLRCGEEALVIIPPFPMPENRLTSSWDTSLILEMLATNYTIGVVLLRLGRYAVAVYQGRRLVSSRADARYVKGRHHAGGSSQKRFQRIREGQARKIYDKTCQAVHEQFTPYSRQLDYILLGGERFTLLGFLKVCPYLEQFQNIILGRRLNIRDPKHDTLEMEVVERLWESRVYQLQWQ